MVRALPTQNSMQSQPRSAGRATTVPVGVTVSTVVGGVHAPTQPRLPELVNMRSSSLRTLLSKSCRRDAHFVAFAPCRRVVATVRRPRRADPPERAGAVAPARHRPQHGAGAARPAAGLRRRRRLRAGARPAGARLPGARVHDAGDRPGPGVAPRIAVLSTIPEVLEIHKITGPGDLMLRVVARDNEHLHAVVEAILAAPGVAGPRRAWRSTRRCCGSTPTPTPSAGCRDHPSAARPPSGHSNSGALPHSGVKPACE